MEETKRCPACGELILLAARKCKHCKTWIEPDPAAASGLRSRLGLAATVLLLSAAGGALGWYALHPPPEPGPRPGSATGSAVAAPPATAPRCGGAEPARGRAGGPAPHPRTLRLRRLAALTAGPVSDKECRVLEREALVPFVLCQLLGGAVRDGRTGAKALQALRRELRARGYLPLRGYLIAQHAEGLYEITRLDETAHALLRSKVGRRLRSYFSIWAKRAGVQEVTTRGGKRQTWDEFEEDAFGTVLPQIFTVAEGEPTREAARLALRSLTLLSP